MPRCGGVHSIQRRCRIGGTQSERGPLPPAEALSAPQCPRLRSALDSAVPSERDSGDAVATRRIRLDKEMVRRHLAATRSEAQALVATGCVRVGGSVADKSSRLVHPADAVHIIGNRPRYVSRGGLKLEAALAEFGIDPFAIRAIDVGASTGGFTDCLLQHGAAEVVAIDVGRNQLHERLRSDSRVMSLEQTDVRAVRLSDIGGPAALVTADLSFISLRLVAPDLCSLATGDMLLLVKPQFEASKADADKSRGVIRDPVVWQQTLTSTATAMTGEGFAVMGAAPSPTRGTSGNVEFFLHLHAHGRSTRTDSITRIDLEECIDSAVARAGSGRRCPF